MEALREIRELALGIDDLTAIERKPKWEDMREMKEELQSRLEKYQESLEKEQRYLNESLNNYNFKLNEIIRVEDSEKREEAFISLSEEYNLDDIMDNLGDLINAIAEVKEVVYSIDNMQYCNEIAKQKIISTIQSLESEELWKEYDLVKKVVDKVS